MLTLFVQYGVTKDNSRPRNSARPAMAGLELFSIDLPFTQQYILVYGGKV